MYLFETGTSRSWSSHGTQLIDVSNLVNWCIRYYIIAQSDETYHNDISNGMTCKRILETRRNGL